MRKATRMFLYVVLGVPFALGAAGGLGACGGGGSAAPTQALPQIVVTHPQADVGVTIASAPTIEIRFTDNDPSRQGRIEIVADRDDQPNTTIDQVVIASNLTPRNGPEFVVPWTVGVVPSGDYAIYVRLRFGDDESLDVIGRAPGRIHVDGFPRLTVAGTPGLTRISRGGLLCYGYFATDRDQVPAVRLTLDADGNYLTTADAYALSLPPNQAGCSVLSTPAVPYDTYRVVGVADDGVNGPTPAVGPGIVEVSDVSWATVFEGAARVGPTDLVVYDDGASLVTGALQGAVTFGLGQANETTLTPAAGDDIYVARFLPSGALAWAKKIGGLKADAAGFLARHPDGGFLLTGQFEDRLTFALGEVNQTNLFAVDGGLDRFLARFDEDGDLVWAKAHGTSREDFGSRVAVFADGSLVTTTVSRDASAPRVDSLFESMERYDADGNLVWSRTLLGTGLYHGFRSLAVYANGDFVVAGWWDGSITLGKGEANEVTLTSTAGADVIQSFIAKYRGNGTLVWARRVTATGHAVVGDIVSLPDGSCAVCGGFLGTGTWGHGETGETQRTSAGEADAFVARYMWDGTLRWVHVTGSAPDTTGGTPSSGGDDFSGLAVLPDGSLVVSGRVFGPTTVENADTTRTLPLGYTGPTAICIRYRADGTIAWLRTDEGAQFQIGSPLLGTTADGSCVRAGSFNYDFTFGANDATPASIIDGGAIGGAYLTRFNADGGY